jgi:hypothetical protein
MALIGHGGRNSSSKPRRSNLSMEQKRKAWALVETKPILPIGGSFLDCLAYIQDILNGKLKDLVPSRLLLVGSVRNRRLCHAQPDNKEYMNLLRFKMATEQHNRPLQMLQGNQRWWPVSPNTRKQPKQKFDVACKRATTLCVAQKSAAKVFLNNNIPPLSSKPMDSLGLYNLQTLTKHIVSKEMMGLGL